MMMRFTFSIPCSTPRARTSTVTSTTTPCHSRLPNGPVICPKYSSDPTANSEPETAPQQ